MIDIVLACTLALSSVPEGHRTYVPRLETCVAIGDAAEEAKLDPALIIALSWVESRFSRKAVSSAGAIGPMQILPRYFCPKKKAKNCDLIQAGIKAFKTWQKRYPKTRETLCHYANGNKCYSNGKRYANKILKLSKNLRMKSLYKNIKREIKF